MICAVAYFCCKNVFYVIFSRWGPNAVLTACIRRHIEKQGGKLDINPLVNIINVVIDFLRDLIATCSQVRPCCLTDFSFPLVSSYQHSLFLWPLTSSSIFFS